MNHTTQTASPAGLPAKPGLVNPVVRHRIIHLPNVFHNLSYYHQYEENQCVHCRGWRNCIGTMIREIHDKFSVEEMCSAVRQHYFVNYLLDMLHPVSDASALQKRWQKVVFSNISCQYIPLQEFAQGYPSFNLAFMSSINQISWIVQCSVDRDAHLVSPFPSFWNHLDQLAVLTTVSVRRLWVYDLYPELKRVLAAEAARCGVEESLVKAHSEACTGANIAASFKPWEKMEGTVEALDKCVKAAWEFARCIERGAWNKRFSLILPFLEDGQALQKIHRAGLGCMHPEQRRCLPAPRPEASQEEACLRKRNRESDEKEDQQERQDLFNDHVAHTVCRFSSMHSFVGKRMLQEALGHSNPRDDPLLGTSTGAEFLASIILLDWFRMLPSTTLCKNVTWDKCMLITVPFFLATHKAPIVHMMWMFYLYTNLCVVGYLLAGDPVAEMHGASERLLVKTEEVLCQAWTRYKDAEELDESERSKQVMEIIDAALDKILAESKEEKTDVESIKEFVRARLLPNTGKVGIASAIYNAMHIKTEMDVMCLMVESFPEYSAHVSVPDAVRESFLSEMRVVKGIVKLHAGVFEGSYELARRAIVDRVWGLDTHTVFTERVQRVVNVMLEDKRKKCRPAPQAQQPEHN